MGPDVKTDGTSGGGPALRTSATSRPTGSPTEIIVLDEQSGLELHEVIGRGARSEVFRARRGDRDYAVKVMLSAADDIEIAFRREAVLLAGVDHPGLSRILEVGSFHGRTYVVMDLISGRPLPVLLASGPLNAFVAVRLALDLSEALAAAHRRGLVHRDVKPHNVIVKPDGTAVLIDFGLVARSRTTPDDENADLAGTLLYTSPEQAGVLHRPVDGRSDLYSLGVLLYECVAGMPPFNAENAGDLLRMHAVASPPDLRVARPRIPETLIVVVEKLLAKDPDDRYQSADALLDDLRGQPADDAPEQVRTRIIGRDHETAQLAASWVAVRGQRGGSVQVRGDRGSGKSLLLEELARNVQKVGLPVLRGRCIEDDPVPLTALRAAVDREVAWAKRLPEPARTRAKEMLREAATPSGSLLRALSPGLATLLPADGHIDEGSTEDRTEQFAVSVASFLANLARVHGGVLLCLDDVQWLDQASRRVLAHLNDELATAPLLLVTTTSDGDPEASTQGSLTLGPLDDAAVSTLIDVLLPGVDVPANLTARLIGACQGNPLMVTEYVGALVEAGLLSPRWGSWTFDAEGLDRLDLAGEAVRLMLGRLSGLDDAGRQMLTRAAVVGSEFDVWVLAEIAGAEREQVLACLTQAVEARLLEARADGRFGFVHGYLRDALLVDVPEPELRWLRHTTALALNKGGSNTGNGDDQARVYAVAWHFMHGEPNRDRSQAFDACYKAGLLALNDHMASDAVRYLEYAASLTEQAQDPTFLRIVGTALQRDGLFPSARDRLEQALAGEQAPLARARILSLLAKVHRSLWETDAALRAVRQGLAELGAPLPRGFRLFLLTIGRIVANWFVNLTGKGRGTATGEERERYVLRANLQTTGGYTAALAMRSFTWAALNLSTPYLAARIGVSIEYARSYAALGFVFRTFHLDRFADAAFGKARWAAQDVGDRPLHAEVAWLDPMVSYMRGIDDGQSLAEVMRTEGRMLDVGSYCDGVGALIGELLLRGDVEQAAWWHRQGEERVRLAGSMVGQTALAPSSLSVPAAQGLSDDAQYREVERLLGDVTLTRTRAIGLLVASAVTLNEHDDTGERFELVASRVAALGLAPLLLMRYNRPIHVSLATGRLSLCRAASDDALPDRLREAERAVRAMGRFLRSPLERAHHRIAKAELQRLQGQPDRALTTLSRITPVTPDAPLVAYESARVRARACHDLGHSGESQRQARLAMDVAQAHGWPHRARWIAAEFGVEAEGYTPKSLTPTSLAQGPHPSGQAERLAALQQVSLAASRVVDPVQLARIALDEIIRILAADRAFLFLAEGPHHQLVPSLGRDNVGQDVEQMTAYSVTLVERVGRTREPLVVTGTDEGEALGARSVVLHGLRSIMAAPVQLDNRLLGVVYLDSRVAKGIFTVSDVGILTAITNQIAASLETARAAQLEVAVRTAQRQRDVAEALRTNLTEMTSAKHPADVLSSLVRAVAQTLPGDKAWLFPTVGAFETIPEGDESPVTAAAAARMASLEGSSPVAWGGGNAPPDLARTLGAATAWLVLPLHLRANRLGTIVLSISHNDGETDYGETEVETAAALVAQAMVAYDNAQLITRLERMATIDELTGLANRREFFAQASREVARSLSEGRTLAVLMADVDHFKKINDTYGHQAGDEVLHEICRRLATEVRPVDVVARYGGEEFCALLPGCDDSELAERLRAAIADLPVQTESAGAITVTMSLGVTWLAPNDDLESMLARADGALYRAKRAGRNRVEPAEQPV
jgi:diguanylate cyclase (GGDEF)-like protein